MEVRPFVMISGMAFLASCSGSPASMLQKGDPKVCVSKAVLNKAYEVVRQNAQAPSDDDIGADNYDQLKSKWLGELSFAASDVVSTSVDRDNQTVTCSGKLHVSGTGGNDGEDAPFAYQVKANLSDSNDPIVSVDVSSIQGALSSILGKIAKPDFDIAQAKRDQSDDALIKQDEDQISSTPGASAKLQAKSRENLVQTMFSSSELSLIDRTYLAHMMCMASDARNRGAFCRKEVRLNREAKTNDLCSTAGNEWYHCSRETELTEQRNALTSANNGNVSGPSY